MTTFELYIILFIAALFAVALAAIVMEEKEEADIFKNWKQD